MKLKEGTAYIKLQKAANGYIATQITSYGNDGSPEIFPTFLDVVIGVAEAFGEANVVATLRESDRLSESLSAFISAAIAPQLLAIEAKVNPGIENIVETKRSEDDLLI